METLTVGIILALRSNHDQHLSDVTPGNDVNNVATAAWAELDARRVIVGGRDRKLLCVLTATVRPPITSTEDGSGSVDEDADVDEHLLRFKHFIFRNRMQISQHC